VKAGCGKTAGPSGPSTIHSPPASISFQTLRKAFESTRAAVQASRALGCPEAHQAILESKGFKKCLPDTLSVLRLVYA
jgi:hypothetical protein